MMNTQSIEKLMKQYLNNEFHDDSLEDSSFRFMFTIYGRNILEAIQCVGIELDTLGAFELVALVKAVGNNLRNMFYEGLETPCNNEEEEMDAKIYQEGYNEGFGDAKEEMLKMVQYMEPENLS